MAHDPIGARRELRDRIKAKLAGANRALNTRIIDLDVDALAGAVMELFYEVGDEWMRVDVTTLAEAGVVESWIDNRFLVARVPAQGVHMERRTDRTVPGVG